MEDIQSIKALRGFLRWVKNVHPHIITEYLETLKGAIKELEELDNTGSDKKL